MHAMLYLGSPEISISVTKSTTIMVRAANPALLKPMTLSPELEAVVGKGPMSRGEVVKQIWVYIKKHDLQNPKNKRNIMADDKLKPIFGGKSEVTMFEMTKLVSAHLS
jgi:chromatin remodeling complex protein RSC6